MGFTRRLLIVLMLGCSSLTSPGVSGQTADDTTSQKPEAAAAETGATRYIISTGQDDEALAALRPEQATWLETESHDRVLALLEREHRSPAKGAVIIVSDVGQTADTGLAGALRKPLAEAGWAAMSLGLPGPPEEMLSQHQSKEADSSEAAMAQADSDPMDDDQAADKEGGASADGKPGRAGVNSAVIDVMAQENKTQMRNTYASTLTSRLAAAGKKLKDLGYSPLIFVGIGHGADAVTAWSLSRGDVSPVIWVAPKLSVAHLEALAKEGASSGRAVLDLVSAQISGSRAADRRSRLRRGNVADYEQQALAISGQPQAAAADEIAHRITGWASRQIQNKGRPL